MTNGIFLTSSFDSTPDHWLQGHCFDGEDLILGDGGYTKFRAARGTLISPGADGSYIVVNTINDEIVMGTDYSGYHKIFLYEHGHNWIVSNSILEIVRLAAKHGLPITIDETHLSSLFIKGSFGNQLTSLHTSVREISLVPSTAEVVIRRTPSGDKVTLRPSSGATPFLSLRNYDDALFEYLRVWTGRMATILQSDLHIRSDLTGGLDSRIVLALMLAAAQRLDPGAIRAVNFRSDRGMTKDYGVASQIAERFDLRFMDEHEMDRGPVKRELREAYSVWKALCLGVYSPIYLPRAASHHGLISLGGAGGESHRRFHDSENLGQFLNMRRRFIPCAKHFMQLRHDVLTDIDTLRQGAEADTPPMVLHYRHFRDRLHGGRSSQYGNVLAPLSGASLKRASSLCSPEKFARRQALADVLLNASPELAAMPFDNPKKSLDSKHVADMVDASDAIRSARLDGQVFAEEVPRKSPGDFTLKGALELLRDDFTRHEANVRRTGYFPASYLRNAAQTVEAAARNGRLPHAVAGAPVAHVILAGELMQLSGSGLSSLSLFEAMKYRLLRR